MPARVAHIAQEDSRLPPSAVTVGSLTRVVHEITVRTARRYPLTVVSTRLPGDPAQERVDGINHLRFAPGADRAVLARWFRWRNRIGRRIGFGERAFPASRSYFYSYIRRIARRLRRENPDVVHLHNVSQFVDPLRAALPDTRLVLHMHCDWLVELPRAVVARRLARVNLVLGVSQHVVGRVQEAFPEVAARCRVLPNGVEPSVFPRREQVESERGATLAALRARLGIRGPVVLFVGRLSSEKGVHVLLDAFAHIRRRFPDATCLVAGPDWGPLRKVRSGGDDPVSRTIARLDTGYMERLRRLAAPHGDRVVFTGPLPNRDLPLYFTLADALAAPSLLESFGIPPIEAGAVGLPVVAAATGGLAETVVPGKTGLLVPPGDAGALAAALEELFDDPERARALGRAARERVLAHFTWDRIADRLAGYYEELLSADVAGRAA